ncbi:MAG: tyrosine-type recombinase/integrase, partial [Hyphomicrobiales bacterium]|nr:tyrosine-type recombinase/integrase [Hyphomicrobiales bacterium]
DLRHFYASLLIDAGEPVKVVQARLGHASASETLDTYAHLWPDNEERTRAAVNEVLGGTHGYARESARAAAERAR